MIRVSLFKYLSIGMRAFDWNSDNVSNCWPFATQLSSYLRVSFLLTQRPLHNPLTVLSKSFLALLDRQSDVSRCEELWAGLVAVQGLEPRTLRIWAACSNRLSYTATRISSIRRWLNSAWTKSHIQAKSEYRNPICETNSNTEWQNDQN